jgi:hypothetical protein
VSNVKGNEFTETVDQYIVTFTIDGEFVTIKVYDTVNKDSVVGRMHFVADPSNLLDDAEMRKRIARTVIKLLPIFRKYHELSER